MASTFASLRLRVTMPNKSLISSGLDGSSLSQPYSTHFSKLIFVSGKKHLFASHHRLQEMVSLFKLGLELLQRKDCRIDRASKLTLSGSQLREDLIQAHVADHHKIHIARAILVPSRHRPVDESKRYFLYQGRESGTKEMECACCLGDQRTEFRVCRMVSVGLIEDLHPGGGPLDQSNLRESLQLSLHGSDTSADLSRNLASKEGLVRHAV